MTQRCLADFSKGLSLLEESGTHSLSISAVSKSLKVFESGGKIKALIWVGEHIYIGSLILWV